MTFTVNKIKYPTFKHLNVNFSEVSNTELLSGFEFINDHKSDPKEILSNCTLPSSNFFKNGWNLENHNYIIKENKKVKSEIKYKSHKQAHHVDIVLEENSEADISFYYDSDDSYLLGDINFQLHENSILKLHLFFINAHDIFYNIGFDLIGNNSEVTLNGAYYCGKDSHYDINLETNHIGTETISELNMNGVLDKNAEKMYKYCLDFQHGCKNSKGSESEVVINLSDDFKNTTVPIMLCGEDSIEASHGATLQEPDDTVLNYIKSRGIDEISAKIMCVEGHFSQTMENFKEEWKKEIFDKLETLI